MYERILQQMRDMIRTNAYIMTIHAEEEMDDEDLSIFDVERILLTGEIIERQRETGTAESKYRIRGKTVGENEGEVIGKISLTDKLVIITIYTDDSE